MVKQDSDTDLYEYMTKELTRLSCLLNSVTFEQALYIHADLELNPGLAP